MHSGPTGPSTWRREATSSRIELAASSLSVNTDYPWPRREEAQARASRPSRTDGQLTAQSSVRRIALASGAIGSHGRQASNRTWNLVTIRDRNPRTANLPLPDWQGPTSNGNSYVHFVTCHRFIELFDLAPQHRRLRALVWHSLNSSLQNCLWSCPKLKVEQGLCNDTQDIDRST